MLQALLAVWPWWSGPLLGVWCVALYESLPVEYEDSPLAVARGIVVMLTMVAALLWVVFAVVWLVRLS